MKLAGVFLSIFLLASYAYPKNDKIVRVLLWSEQTEPRNVYPRGISGALYDHFKSVKGFEPKMAALSDPETEAVILEGTWETGHRNRECLVWTLGKGRLVYIRPGHEEYPIYFMPEMRRLVANATLWAAGRTHAPKNMTKRNAGPPATATGPYKKPETQ